MENDSARTYNIYKYCTGKFSNCFNNLYKHAGILLEPKYASFTTHYL